MVRRSFVPRLARPIAVMPHTTTKTSRTKRTDTRPNEKMRRKLKRQIEDEKVIQDIRVTKKSKDERKEREVQRTPLANLGSKEDKIVRALRKKLKKIDGLITKQKNGETLDEQQLQCIATLDSVLAEMEEFLSGGRLARAEDDENEADEEQ